MPEAQDKSLCIVTAALLRRGIILHVFSLIMTALSLAQVYLPLSPTPCTTAASFFVIVVGIAELYFSLRVALDADLFDALGNGFLDGENLDVSLNQLGLKANFPLKRSVENRSLGALRLMKFQASCMALQAMAFLLHAIFANFLCILSF
ncbi:MAG: hypothetical protein PW788_11540 [Micavibrio sp.]|nr:hypothetical protein [Micavibrio sp.]